MAERGLFWNKAMETPGADEYHHIQDRALNRQLDYVWQASNFYKDKLQAAGLERGDISGLDDLAQLPFTEKYELRESLLAQRPLGRHAARDIADVVRVYSTSGTTGVPTYIGLTGHDRDVWMETTNRAMWTCGMRPRHIVPLPIGTFFIAASYGEAIENLGATLIPVGVGATDRLIGALNNLGADYILATSSFPLYLMDYCARKGIDGTTLGIERFMLGGEPGAGNPEVRRKIKDAFGADVREVMGNGDMLGLMWAECEHGNGMHFIGQGACHAEIIDPESGAPKDIQTGTTGELVYTSLDRQCQPLVRFRTRDHVEVTKTSCDCGRTGFAVKCIGRTDDMLIISGVNVYPSAVRDVVSSLAPATTGEIQIQLHEPPPAVTSPMHIKVEHAETPGDLDQLAAKIKALLREKLVFSSKIELVKPGSLPKFEYKAKLVKPVYEEG